MLRCYLIILSEKSGLVRGTVGGATGAGAGRADGAHGALPTSQAGGGRGRCLEHNPSLCGLYVAQDLDSENYYYCVSSSRLSVEGEFIGELELLQT